MDFDTTLIVTAIACFIVGVVVGEFRQAHKFIAKVSKDPDSMINLLTQLKTELARLKSLEEHNLPEDAIQQSNWRVFGTGTKLASSHVAGRGTLSWQEVLAS